MVLNPRRGLTPVGQKRVLDMLRFPIVGAFSEALRLALVTEFSLNPLTHEIQTVTAGGAAIGALKPLEDFSELADSQTGKRYTRTGPIQGVAAGLTEPVTIIGAVVGTSLTPSEVISFYEFDAPITFDQNGEGYISVVEYGFDRNEFYIAVRMMPLGT